MRSQQEEAHHLGVVVLEDVADDEEIAERLRHFLASHLQELVMHPVLHERLAGRTLGLGDFVFVMRKLQVHAAAVQIELLAEERAAHGGALDMPSGPAFAPGRRPLRLVGLGTLPQHEVERVLLRRVDIDSLARAQLVE